MNEQNIQIAGEALKKAIVNFAFLSAESLSSLSDALGLKMGLSDLSVCREYYKKERLPDLTLGELILIDKVFSDKERRLSVPLIATFSTNDQLVAQTYADLMTRRKAIEPNHTSPCSVTELLDILPAYAKGDFDNTSNAVALICGKNRVANAAMRHYMSYGFSDGDSNDAIIGIKSVKATGAASERGDVIYAVLKSFNDLPDFDRRLNAFISSAEVAASGKRINYLDNESVITLLSENYEGIRLNLAPYEAKLCGEAPYKLLAESDVGVTVCANKQTAADMLITAQELGLRVIILGTVSGSSKIEAHTELERIISLDTKFLRSLGFSRPVSCEADGTELDIKHSEFIRTPIINKIRYKLCSAERTCGNAFISGFETVLYTYSMALLGGCDTIYAGAYKLPLTAIDKKTLGTSLELILGAYRAQCELGIYDSWPSVECGDSASLRFHALSKVKRIVPTKIVGKESYIYYLEPLFDENGLPDFDDLKKMHGYISSLINDKIVLSACPTRSNLIATLDKMSEDTCVEYVRRDNIISRVGGFIVETTQKIQGTYIARTTGQIPDDGNRNPIFSPSGEQIASDT